MRYDRGITTLSPWPRGMNNLTSDRGLPDGDDGAVRNAVNVDFAGPEELYSRKGMKKVCSAVNARGGFSCAAGAFFIDSGQIMKVEDYLTLIAGTDTLVAGSDTLTVT